MDWYFYNQLQTEDQTEVIEEEVIVKRRVKDTDLPEPRHSTPERISLDSTSLSSNVAKLKQQQQLSTESPPMLRRKRSKEKDHRGSKTLPRGLGCRGGFLSSSVTSSQSSGENCDVYGLYGDLMNVKDYENENNILSGIDPLYETLRRSDPELAAIPNKVRCHKVLLVECSRCWWIINSWFSSCPTGEHSGSQAKDEDHPTTFLGPLQLVRGLAHELFVHLFRLRGEHVDEGQQTLAEQQHRQSDRSLRPFHQQFRSECPSAWTFDADPPERQVKQEIWKGLATSGSTETHGADPHGRSWLRQLETRAREVLQRKRPKVHDLRRERPK